ncbi:MAG TPA: type II toxin-antitoxin system PemK/MazF family toxin [bacterium]|nr:type II toxin-antitoxin system PemK/MazF family toxin [bacterium]
MVDENSIRRGEIYIVDLRPSRGGEIRKARPCLVVSPDELNKQLATFIVAPLTSGRHAYPFRVPCTFQGKSGHIVLDQIRTIDRERLLRRMGKLPTATMTKVLALLQEMFAP